MKFDHIKTSFAVSVPAVGLLILLLCLCFPATPRGASATDASLDVPVSLTVANQISLTTSPSSVSINFTPTAAGSTLQTADVAISATTNNYTGLTVTLSSKTTNTALVNTTDATKTIPTLSAASTAANFPLNKWGFSTDSGSNYSAIASSASPATLATTSAPGTSSPTIRVATRADMSIPDGTYHSTLTATAVTNAPPAFGGITTMQEMTNAICVAEQRNTTASLVDVRDGTTYTVAKLADDKCWMTQNLDFNIDATTTQYLNSDYTDVSSWTPERLTIATGQLSSSTWSNDAYRPYSYDSGDTTYGNYYNWSSAVAMNRSPDMGSGTSVCPKGWTLPSDGAFGSLLSIYGVIDSPYSTEYTTNGFEILTSAPLNFVRGGSIYSGSISTGSSGYYWTSTGVHVPGSYVSSQMYTLQFTSSDIDPRSKQSRYYGYSVRCVARS